MNILSIGNSFSQDATRYIHEIARADGVEINTVNLYIGGCTLGRHYRNMLGNKKEYIMEFNGISTEFKVTIEEALLSRDWDVVTLQQQSLQSADFETFSPYIGALSSYVKKLAPKTKQLLHQTWAYENGSEKLKNSGFATHAAMFEKIKGSYQSAAKMINADGIIRSGELFNKYNCDGVKNIYRDAFHASLGFGRYSLGLLWYKTLTRADVMQNTFCDFDEHVSEMEIDYVKKAVCSL